jgi:succinylglutamic semialdehyde dehydrogenase
MDFMDIELINSMPAHIIAGKEVARSSGSDAVSMNPYSGETLWSSAGADNDLISEAVVAAKKSFEVWASFPLEGRAEVLQSFTTIVQREKDYLAALVAMEAGKPLWESRVEVNSLVTKLTASLDAYKTRCAETSREVKGLLSRTRYRPHGVMGVLGPYNFPLSMANGHIMPALLAGNTIVFKPSELTPLTGLAVARLWQEAGLPPGVMNCLTGGKAVGQALVEHAEVDGILFVGSPAAGLAILRTLVSNPQKIVALEMGGNSPLVIEDFDQTKVDAVVSIIIHSAFISSGQRCSAARRLYLNEKYEGIIERLIEVAGNLRIGSYLNTPEPFYGPMIRPEAVNKVQIRFDDLRNGGGVPLLTPTVSGPNQTMMSPGLIDVSNAKTDRDEELFGPVLKIRKYSDLRDAIEMSNDTKYGLAAGIVTQDREKYEDFFRKVKAGIVNWNQQLTGATTFAPFGGVKQSGNFRPAGYLSADYCSYALASFEVESSALLTPDTPGIRF